MKNFKSFTLFTLFALVATEEIQSKAACVKGYEWRNGRCRKKKKNQKNEAPAEQTAPNQPTPAPEQDLPVMGANPATYAPQLFNPSKKYSGTGLVGNYFKSSKVATIHDPSGKNTKNFTFKQVQEGGVTPPAGLESIGNYLQSPPCSPGKMCAMVMRVVNLYGKLKADEQLSRRAFAIGEPIPGQELSDDEESPVKGIAVGEPYPVQVTDPLILVHPNAGKLAVITSKFTPDSNLMDDPNISGIYDITNRTATIMNYAGEKLANFINIQELPISTDSSNSSAPEGLLYIGYMVPTASCPECASKIELYGEAEQLN